MRKTSTIDSNLRCPKCYYHWPMAKIPKSKNIRCIYCGYECLPKDCIPFKKICKSKECV